MPGLSIDVGGWSDFACFISVNAPHGSLPEEVKGHVRPCADMNDRPRAENSNWAGGAAPLPRHDRGAAPCVALHRAKGRNESRQSRLC